MLKYYDKDGREIKSGDDLTDGRGYFEKVYACKANEDSETNDDLGINAVNWDSPAANKPLFYSLSDIDLSDLHVV